MKTVMMVGTAQDVSDVIVDGKVLIKDKVFTTLDEEAIIQSGKEQMHKLLSRCI